MIAQPQLDWVDEGALDYEIAPRSHAFFQKTLTEGYQVILNWETLNEKAIGFWIGNSSWDLKMPPASAAVVYSGYSWKMFNYRFKAPHEGQWYFIFYNDAPIDYTVSIHWTIFKEAGAPEIRVQGAPYVTQTKPNYMLMFTFLSLGGIVSIIIVTKYRESHLTALERRKRRMAADHQKRRRKKARRSKTW